MIFAWTEAQLDQRPRVRDFFGLPAVVGLVAAHGVFTGLVPAAAGRSAQIMLANQSLLDGGGSLGVNFLLSARAHRLVFSGGTFCARGGFSRGPGFCAGRFFC